MSESLGATALPLSMPGIVALRRALPAVMEPAFGARSPSVDPLRLPARLLAGAARAEDPIRAERLLIMLKAIWAELPEVQQLPLGGPREAVWNCLVTLCVKEFYAPAVTDAATRAN